MFRLILRRLAQAVPVAFLVTALVFSTLWLVPGDPVHAFVPPGEVLDEQQLDLLRKEHNLDKPIPVQYAIWLGKVVQGDFGRSLQTKRSVSQELWSRGQVTFALGVTGWLLSIALAIPIGILSAVQRGRWTDMLATFFSIGAVAIPGVWLGIMMILLFGVTLGWLPVQGYVPISQDPVEWFRHILLPAFAIGVTSSALVMRQTRSAMLEVLAQDYVRTARAKGMSKPVIVWVHALRNALLPVVTLLGLQTGQIFAGSVVIETLFGIPGMGRFLVDAIFQRDFVVVQGGVVVMATAVLIANLLTDLTYGWLDPRVNYDG
jgi:peptide/nickel transport system permease protein